MLSAHFIILLLTSSSVACEGDDCLVKSSKGKSYVNSFTNIAEKVRKFFKVPFDIVEKYRLRLKKGFYEFFNIASGRNESLVSKPIERNKSDTFRTGVIVPLSIETSTAKPSPPPPPFGSGLVTLHGYKNDVHSVTTADGYVLSLLRIFPAQQKSKKKHKSVLLHHDLLGSSDDWLLLGPDVALPYQLSDNGFDVWLANARGNRYSRKHSTKTADSEEFWDFTWHEIGKFDLPAVIEHIINFKKSDSTIDFIGHGMGCTALLVLLSTSPQYNFILNSAIFLGPLIYMKETEGPLRFLAEFQSQYGDEALSLMGESQFMPHGRLPRPLVEIFCKEKASLCSNPWLMIADGAKGDLNPTIADLIDRYVPAGTSTKTVSHYCQMIRSGSFRMFDHGGAASNIPKYGISVPPAYNLSSVELSMTVFSSNDDMLATVLDATRLVTHLPNPAIHRIVSAKGFTHTSFVWSEDSQKLVINEVILLLNSIH